MAAALTACNASVSQDSTHTTTETFTETQKQIPESLPDNAPKTEVVVAIPEKGADWVDHQFTMEGAKLVVSAPPTIRVNAGEESVYVDLNGQNGMNIVAEPLDMAKEKQWYVESDSRQDLKWLIDSDGEALYTGMDLSAPKGYQTTHSFFASKKVGNLSFSTNVDGILITDSKIFSLTAQEAQLLLGIFRTLRAQ